MLLQNRGFYNRRRNLLDLCYSPYQKTNLQEAEMSHSFEEPRFKGKLVSELNKQELGQYRRENLKRAKKAVKKRQVSVVSEMIKTGIITEDGLPVSKKS
jgi:hypothetical protein